MVISSMKKSKAGKGHIKWWRVLFGVNAQGKPLYEELALE